jgi:hypothetical protein
MLIRHPLTLAFCLFAIHLKQGYGGRPPGLPDRRHE